MKARMFLGALYALLSRRTIRTGSGLLYNNASGAFPFRCESTKMLLTDIEALVRADATVGLARSNIYRVSLVRRACAGRFESRKNAFDWQGRDMIGDIIWLDE